MPLNFNRVSHDVLNLMDQLAMLPLMNNYILVGETALTMHLNHIEGNDLEFLSLTGNLDSENIIRQLSQVFQDLVEVKLENKKYHIKINSVDIYFYSNKQITGTVSTNLYNNLHVADLELLTALAVNSFFTKTKFRDFYKLYVINKEVFPLDEIYNIHKKYINHTSQKLFQKEIIWVFDTENENLSEFKPKYDLDILSIGKHFESEIIRWNSK